MKKLINKIVNWFKWVLSLFTKGSTEVQTEEVKVKTDLEKFGEKAKDLIDRVENTAKTKTEVIGDEIMVFDNDAKKFVAVATDIKTELVSKAQEELAKVPELFTGVPQTGSTAETIIGTGKTIVTSVTGEQKVVTPTKKYTKKS